MSASHYIMSAWRCHPHYQSRCLMYIRCPSPLNIAELAEAVPNDTTATKILWVNSTCLFSVGFTRMDLCADTRSSNSVSCGWTYPIWSNSWWHDLCRAWQTTGIYFTLSSEVNAYQKQIKMVVSQPILVKSLMFSSHLIKYIWHLPQKSKYPVFNIWCRVWEWNNAMH